MKSRGNHLQEECLFECYLAVRDGEALDPPVVEHLTDCKPCGDRYLELTQFMDSLGTEATVATDAIFTPDRLRIQRQQIVRKLEYLEHPARVIAFPGRSAIHPVGSSTSRPARRWIAAAAAAGLFIGVGTGILLDWEGRPGRRAAGALARQTVLTEPSDPAVVTNRIDSRLEILRPDSMQEDDRAFLSELEFAGDRPHIRELSAVDALTPHVREITLR